MNGLRSTLAFGLALLLGVLVAGCSSSDEKNDYVDQINELQALYNDELSAVSVPTNLAEVRDLAAKGSELDAQLADDVAAVDPPEEVADLHEELVATLEVSAAASADLEKVVRTTNNRSELEKALTEADRNTDATIDKFNSLIDQINEEL